MSSDGNLSTLTFSPKFVSDLLGTTPGYIRKLEEDLGIEVGRVMRGSVEARSYSTDNIFELQWRRRSKGDLKGLASQKIITVFVRKGGVAKTTLAVNLAINLQLQGLRVLLVDNDPQGDATSMLGYDPDRSPEELKEEGLPADLGITGHWGNLLPLPNSRTEPMVLDQIIKYPFGKYGPHLIPAYEALEDMNTSLNASMHSDLRYSLFIAKARNGEIQGVDLAGYDVIIFDNSPSSAALSRNAMVAADMLVCPIRFDKFSLRALSRLEDMLVEFSDATGRSPDVVPVPTMFSRTRPRMQRNLATLSERFPNHITEHQLHQTEDYNKALDENVPIAFFKQATSLSIDAMRAVSMEILARLKLLDGSKK